MGRRRNDKNARNLGTFADQRADMMCRVTTPSTNLSVSAFIGLLADTPRATSRAHHCELYHHLRNVSRMRSGSNPPATAQSVCSVGALNLISRCTFHAADAVQYVLHFTVLDMFVAMAGPSFWEVTTFHRCCEVHWSLRSFVWCLAVSVPLRSALYGNVVLRWFRAKCAFGVAEGEWW